MAFLSLGKAGFERRQRKPEGLKSEHKDCFGWVGYCYPATHTRKIRLPNHLLIFPEILLAAGADETEQKHLL